MHQLSHRSVTGTWLWPLSMTCDPHCRMMAQVLSPVSCCPFTELTYGVEKSSVYILYWQERWTERDAIAGPGMHLHMFIIRFPNLEWSAVSEPRMIGSCIFGRGAKPTAFWRYSSQLLHSGLRKISRLLENKATTFCLFAQHRRHTFQQRWHSRCRRQ